MGKLQSRLAVPLFILAVASPLRGDFYPPLTVTDIRVEEKVNGVLVRIACSGQVVASQLAAGSGDTSWQYLTIYDARLDSGALIGLRPVGFVTSAEVLQLEEAVQISLQLSRPVAPPEISIGRGGSEIEVALRQPLSVAYASRDERAIALTEEVGTVPLPPTPARRQSLFLAAAGVLVLAGLLAEDASLVALGAAAAVAAVVFPVITDLPHASKPRQLLPPRHTL